MANTWIQDLTHRPLLLAGVAVVLTVVTLAAAPAIRGNALERFAIGTWSCTGTHVDTPRVSRSDADDATLPEPFSGLTEEIQPFGLDVYPFRPPQSASRYGPFNATVAVHPDGLIELSGIRYDGDTVHTGTWTEDNGLHVVRFNTGMPDHAVHIVDDDTTQVLAWDGPYPDLHDVQLSRNDAGVVDLRFSTGVEGYEARCIKHPD